MFKLFSLSLFVAVIVGSTPRDHSHDRLTPEEWKVIKAERDRTIHRMFYEDYRNLDETSIYPFVCSDSTILPILSKLVTDENRSAIASALRKVLTAHTTANGGTRQPEGGYISAAAILAEISDSKDDFQFIKSLLEPVMGDGQDGLHHPLGATLGVNDPANSREEWLVLQTGNLFSPWASMAARLGEEPTALSLLRGKAEVANYELRTGALRALGYLRTPESVAAITQILESFEGRLPKPYATARPVEGYSIEDGPQMAGFGEVATLAFALHRIGTDGALAAVRTAVERWKNLYANDPGRDEAYKRLLFDFFTSEIRSSGMGLTSFPEEERKLAESLAGEQRTVGANRPVSSTFLIVIVVLLLTVGWLFARKRFNR